MTEIIRNDNRALAQDFGMLVAFAGDDRRFLLRQVANLVDSIVEETMDRNEIDREARFRDDEERKAEELVDWQLEYRIWYEKLHANDSDFWRFKFEERSFRFAVANYDEDAAESEAKDANFESDVFGWVMSRRPDIARFELENPLSSDGTRYAIDGSLFFSYELYETDYLDWYLGKESDRIDKDDRMVALRDNDDAPSDFDADWEDRESRAQHQEPEDEVIGEIIIHVNGEDYIQPIHKSEFVYADVMRAARNGRDPASALLQLAEVGSKVVDTRSPIQPAEFAVSRKNFLGD